MNLQQPDLKVIISGGGTGGHIFPAVSIAQYLKKANPLCDILFVGAKGRMEMEKIPAAGYRIIGLNIAGFQRRFTFANVLLPFRVIASLMAARKIIRDFKPDVVVGVGGYASGPVLFVASLMGIPTLIQEQNSFAGATNRILSKRVNKICVAYEGMERYFPKGKIMLTGNPVREDLQRLNEKRAEALSHFEFRTDKPVLLVIGGSLGARTINKAIANGLNELKENNIQLLWQTGKSGSAEAATATNGMDKAGIKAVDFISRMDYAYAMADVVVSRAGASSVSELAIAGKAAILVPSPNVAEDHQTKNAMALVRKKAALLINDRDAESMLVKQVIALLNDKESCGQLEFNIKQLALPAAAQVIATEICKLAETKK